MLFEHKNEEAMKFEDEAHREKIRQAKTAEEAAKLGKSRKPKRRKDWKKTSTVVMTRGTYIKCRVTIISGEVAVICEERTTSVKCSWV